MLQVQSKTYRTTQNYFLQQAKEVVAMFTHASEKVEALKVIQPVRIIFFISTIVHKLWWVHPQSYVKWWRHLKALKTIVFSFTIIHKITVFTSTIVHKIIVFTSTIIYEIIVFTSTTVRKTNVCISTIVHKLIVCTSTTMVCTSTILQCNRILTCTFLMVHKIIIILR